jgi:hypothetical protein
VDNNIINEYGYLNKDLIDEGNCYTNFLLHWAYRIIKLSKLTNIKPDYFGKLITNIKSIIVILICTVINNILSVIWLYYFRVFIRIFSNKKTPKDWNNKNDLMIPFFYLLIWFLNYILQRKNINY